MQRFALVIFQGIVLEIILVIGAFLLSVGQPSWVFSMLLFLIIATLSTWTARRVQRFSYLAGTLLSLPMLIYFSWYFVFVRPELAPYLLALLPIVLGASLIGSGIAAFKRPLSSL